MNKLTFFFCSFLFLACSNPSAEDQGTSKDSAINVAATPATRLPEEAELEILAGCVDNAKATLGDTKAFALCKCVLGQVQKKHPTADSAAIIGYLSDTTEVAAMAKNCQ